MSSPTTPAFASTVSREEDMVLLDSPTRAAGRLLAVHVTDEDLIKVRVWERIQERLGWE